MQSKRSTGNVAVSVLKAVNPVGLGLFLGPLKKEKRFGVGLPNLGVGEKNMKHSHLRAAPRRRD